MSDYDPNQPGQPYNPNPSGQGSSQNPYGENPYGQQPSPYGQNPYGQNPNPYGQPQAPGYDQYGQQGGYAGVQPPTERPRTLAIAFGLILLAGIFSALASWLMANSNMMANMIGQQWSLVQEEFEKQMADKNSFWHWMRKLIDCTHELEELNHGEIELIRADESAILIHSSTWNGNTTISIHNLSAKPCTVHADFGKYDISEFEDVFGDKLYDKADGDAIKLNGYGYRWLRRKKVEGVRGKGKVKRSEGQRQKHLTTETQRKTGAFRACYNLPFDS